MAGFGLDVRDREGGALQIALESLGLLALADIEAGDLATVGADETRVEDAAILRREGRDERPIFLATEGFDLELAVADEAQRHRLHAAGRAGARQLAPEDRREIEADEIIEGAAGQIGIDQRLVDLARVAQRRRAPSPW